MEIEKDALYVQVIIMEGEKKDFEARISELESRESAANQQVGELKTQVEELVVQKGSLENQLKIANEKKQDITHFRDQACKIRRKIHQAQVNLSGEIYEVKLIVTRLKVIAAESLNFRKGLMEVAKKVKIQLTKVEVNSKFPEDLLQKIADGIK